MPKTEWPQVLVFSSIPGRWLPGLPMFEAWPGLKRRAFWSRVSIGCAGSMIRNCKQWPDPGPGCNLYKSFETIWAFLKMWGRAERYGKIPKAMGTECTIYIAHFRDDLWGNRQNGGRQISMVCHFSRFLLVDGVLQFADWELFSKHFFCISQNTIKRQRKSKMTNLHDERMTLYTIMLSDQ